MQTFNSFYELQANQSPLQSDMSVFNAMPVDPEYADAMKKMYDAINTLMATTGQLQRVAMSAEDREKASQASDILDDACKNVQTAMMKVVRMYD